jgi:hypothetical protein
MDGSLPPVPVPLDCAGSLLPVPGLRPGLDKVRCDICGRTVFVRPPPPEGFRDPWAGSKDPRINPHWSNPMSEMEPGS